MINFYFLACNTSFFCSRKCEVSCHWEELGTSIMFIRNSQKGIFSFSQIINLLGIRIQEIRPPVSLEAGKEIDLKRPKSLVEVISVWWMLFFKEQVWCNDEDIEIKIEQPRFNSTLSHGSRLGGRVSPCLSVPAHTGWNNWQMEHYVFCLEVLKEGEI